MKKSWINSLLVAFVVISCHHEPKKAQLIGKANWLTGDWQRKTDKGELNESWRQLDDSTWIGKSYFMAGKDTLSMENIRLEQRLNKLAYIPVVKDQNNGQAVHFTMTYFSDSSLVFENPEHDFPQKITYTQVSKDSMIAEVSAIVAGELKSQTFRMGKVMKASTVQGN